MAEKNHPVSKRLEKASKYAKNQKEPRQYLKSQKGPASLQNVEKASNYTQKVKISGNIQKVKKSQPIYKSLKIRESKRVERANSNSRFYKVSKRVKNVQIASKKLERHKQYPKEQKW